MHTHTPREILTDLWLRAGGQPAELAAAKLTGGDAFGRMGTGLAVAAARRYGMAG